MRDEMRFGITLVGVVALGIFGLVAMTPAPPAANNTRAVAPAALPDVAAQLDGDCRMTPQVIAGLKKIETLVSQLDRVQASQGAKVTDPDTDAAIRWMRECLTTPETETLTRDRIQFTPRGARFDQVAATGRRSSETYAWIGWPTGGGLNPQAHQVVRQYLVQIETDGTFHQLAAIFPTNSQAGRGWKATALHWDAAVMLPGEISERALKEMVAASCFEQSPFFDRGWR